MQPTQCLPAMEVQSIVGTWRFTQSEPRPLKFMTSGGDKSIMICTNQSAEETRGRTCEHFFENSNKRLMTEFHKLVLTNRKSGINYLQVVMRVDRNFEHKGAWLGGLRCLSELTLIILGLLSTSTYILCSPAQSLPTWSPRAAGPGGHL